jgi:Mrp family chromosome partitioning ATPase
MLDASNYYFGDGEPEREVTMPRRANDTFAMIDGPELPMLFDSFWQPAELALLFGHPGVGKSLLAVQIAEAIARGNRILGEGAAEIPPQRVLYVDLVMSAR